MPRKKRGFIEESPAQSVGSENFLSHSQTGALLSMVEDHSISSEDEQESLEEDVISEEGSSASPEASSASHDEDGSLDSNEHKEKRNKMKALLSEYGLDQDLSSEDGSFQSHEIDSIDDELEDSDAEEEEPGAHSSSRGNFQAADSRLDGVITDSESNFERESISEYDESFNPGDSATVEVPLEDASEFEEDSSNRSGDELVVIEALLEGESQDDGSGSWSHGSGEEESFELPSEASDTEEDKNHGSADKSIYVSSDEASDFEEDSEQGSDAMSEGSFVEGSDHEEESEHESEKDSVEDDEADSMELASEGSSDDGEQLSQTSHSKSQPESDEESDEPLSDVVSEDDEEGRSLSEGEEESESELSGEIEEQSLSDEEESEGRLSDENEEQSFSDEEESEGEFTEENEEQSFSDEEESEGEFTEESEGNEEINRRLSQRSTSTYDADPFESPKSRSGSLRMAELNSAIEEVGGMIADGSSGEVGDLSMRSDSKGVNNAKRKDNQVGHQTKGRVVPGTSTRSDSPTSDTSDAQSFASDNLAEEPSMSSTSTREADSVDTMEKSPRLSREEVVKKQSKKKQDAKSADENAQPEHMRTVRRISLGKSGPQIERSVRQISFSKRKKGRRSEILQEEEERAQKEELDDSSAESPILSSSQSSEYVASAPQVVSDSDSSHSEDSSPVLLIKRPEESQKPPLEQSKAIPKNGSRKREASASTESSRGKPNSNQPVDPPVRSHKNVTDESLFSSQTSELNAGNEPKKARKGQTTGSDQPNSESRNSKKDKAKSKKQETLTSTETGNVTKKSKRKEKKSKKSKKVKGERAPDPEQNSAMLPVDPPDDDDDSDILIQMDMDGKLIVPDDWADSASDDERPYHASNINYPATPENEKPRSRFFGWARGRQKDKGPTLDMGSSTPERGPRKRSNSSSSLASIKSLSSTGSAERTPRTPGKALIGLLSFGRRPPVDDSPGEGIGAVQNVNPPKSPGLFRARRRNSNENATPHISNKPKSGPWWSSRQGADTTISKSFEEPKTVAQQREERQKLYVLDQQRRSSITIQSALRGYMARKSQGTRIQRAAQVDNENEKSAVNEAPSTKSILVSSDHQTVSKEYDNYIPQSHERPAGMGLRSRPNEAFKEPKTVAEQREMRRQLYLKDQERRNAIVIQAALRGYVERQKLGIKWPPPAKSNSQSTPPKSQRMDRELRTQPNTERRRSQSPPPKSAKWLSFLKPKKNRSTIDMFEDGAPKKDSSEPSNIQRFDASLYLRKRMYNDEHETPTKSLTEIRDDRRRMYLYDLRRREAVKIQAATRGFNTRKKLFPKRYERLRKREKRGVMARKTKGNRVESSVNQAQEKREIAPRGVVSFDRSSYLIDRLQRDEASRQMKSVAEIRRERQEIYKRDLERREAIKIQAAMRGYSTRKRYPGYARTTQVEHVRSRSNRPTPKASGSVPRESDTPPKPRSSWKVVKNFLFGNPNETEVQDEEEDEQSFEKFDPYADSLSPDFFGFKEAKRRHRTGFFELEKTERHDVTLHAYTADGRQWTGRKLHASPINPDQAAYLREKKARDEFLRQSESMAHRRQQKMDERPPTAMQSTGDKEDLQREEKKAMKKHKKKLKKEKKKRKKEAKARAREQMPMSEQNISKSNKIRESNSPGVDGLKHAAKAEEEIILEYDSETEEVVIEDGGDGEWEEEVVEPESVQEPEPIQQKIILSVTKQIISKHSGLTHSTDVGVAYWLPSVGTEDSRSYKDQSWVPDNTYQKYYRQKPAKVATNSYWETVRNAGYLPSTFNSASGDAGSGTLARMVPRIEKPKKQILGINHRSIPDDDLWLPPSDPRIASRSLAMGNADDDDQSEDSWVPLPSRKPLSRPRRIDFAGETLSKKEESWAPHLPSPSRREKPSIEKVRISSDYDAPLTGSKRSTSSKKRILQASRALDAMAPPAEDVGANILLEVPLGNTEPYQVSQEVKDQRAKTIMLILAFLFILGGGAVCAYYFWEDAPWN